MYYEKRNSLRIQSYTTLGLFFAFVLLFVLSVATWDVGRPTRLQNTWWFPATLPWAALFLILSIIIAFSIVINAIIHYDRAGQHGWRNLFIALFGVFMVIFYIYYVQLSGKSLLPFIPRAFHGPSTTVYDESLVVVSALELLVIPICALISTYKAKR